MYCPGPPFHQMLKNTERRGKTWGNDE